MSREVFRKLKKTRRTDAQVQEDRRRAGHVPAIHDATIQPPIGSSVRYWGLEDPVDQPNWLIEDGRELDPILYPEAFDFFGTRFNLGNETAGFFRIPDSRDRVAVGASATKAVGAKGGSETVTLSTAEMPVHAHGTNTTSAGGHSHGGLTGQENGHQHTLRIDRISNTTTGGSADRLTGFGNTNQANTDGTSSVAGVHNHSIPAVDGHTHAIESAGAGGAHTNMQPYIAANYIVRIAL